MYAQKDEHDFFAWKCGEWEEYSATDWAFDRIKEAFEKMAKEARKLSTVQEIMKYSAAHHRASGGEGQGGVTMSYLCPHCNCFPMEDCVWWVCGEKA